MPSKSSKPKKDSGDGKANSPGKVSNPDRLPFEPASTRKKVAKKAAPASAVQTTEQVTDAQESRSAQPAGSRSAAVPEVVSRRMARRMAFFCGIPTSLGMLTFVVSYFIVTQNWLKIPNVAVVLVSMGFFGLGVLGLTYGVLSASWDESRVGSWFGWEEFTVNFGRLTESWRTARQKPSA